LRSYLNRAAYSSRIRRTSSTIGSLAIASVSHQFLWRAQHWGLEAR
jgi:hypothetical protein